MGTDESLGVEARSPEAVGFAVSADCYAEMRRIARRLLHGDRQREQLQPTDLAHDALLRLMQSGAAAAQNEGHALALGVRTMRRVLIDEVRRAASAKRHMPTMLPTILSPRETPIDVAVLDAALRALDEVSPEHAEVVELRFALGLTVEEAAAALGVAPRTVKRRWQSARAWLHDYLNDGPDGAGPGA